jgi:hypothetical protein
MTPDIMLYLPPTLFFHVENTVELSYYSTLMKWSKVVIPAKAGIQTIGKQLKPLDSRFHGNDTKGIIFNF